MTNKRKLTEQLKKLKEVFSDILEEVQFLEIDAVTTNADKGLNIVIAIEEDNEDRRKDDNKKDS